MNPILYSFVRCPYAIRARMALIESRINFSIREVNLKSKPAHLLQISPKGTVPVLILPDGTIIEESLDIIYYAAERNELLNMKQYSQEKQNQIKELIFYNESEFIKLARIYKYPGKYPDESADICRKEIEEQFLTKYENMLENSDFLLGGKSIADIALLPFVRQFAKVDEDWFFSSKYLNIIRWLKNITETDIFKNVVMVKNPPWQEVH